MCSTLCLAIVQVEYNIEPCSAIDSLNDQCFDNQRAVVTMPTGGYIVYGVAHQHTGGLGATLYGEVLFFYSSDLASARPYCSFSLHMIELNSTVISSSSFAYLVISEIGNSCKHK